MNLHDSSILWLRVAAALYAVGLLHTILTVLRRKPVAIGLVIEAFRVGVLLHVVSFAEQWMAAGHPPVDNFWQSISLCALLIAGWFLVIYWKYQFASLGVFLFPLVFVMTLIGAMETPVGGWTNPGVRGAWLGAHVVFVMLGYAALLLTALASVFYLIQERRLKAKATSPMFDKLPPLGTLDNLINRSMSIGFTLITLATIAGSTWAFVESGTRWITEGKIIISLFTWLLFLLMVFLRTSAGWRGRKAALMSLSVLGSSALTWVAHTGLLPLLPR